MTCSTGSYKTLVLIAKKIKLGIWHVSPVPDSLLQPSAHPARSCPWHPERWVLPKPQCSSGTLGCSPGPVFPGPAVLCQPGQWLPRLQSF